MKNTKMTLKDTSNGETLGIYETNCPKNDLKVISGLVQDANINLSCGDEVHKFKEIIQILGYNISEIDEDFVVEI